MAIYKCFLYASRWNVRVDFNIESRRSGLHCFHLTFSFSLARFLPIHPLIQTFSRGLFFNPVKQREVRGKFSLLIWDLSNRWRRRKQQKNKTKNKNTSNMISINVRTWELDAKQWVSLCKPFLVGDLGRRLEVDFLWNFVEVMKETRSLLLGCEEKAWKNVQKLFVLLMGAWIIQTRSGARH